MTTSARWTLGCLLGIGAWIASLVLVAMLNNDPRNPIPVVLTFTIGAAVFFGAVFGIALWQTRRRPSAGLEPLLAELTLAGQTPPTTAAAFLGARRTVRAYLVLGIVVTTLGLAAILQGVLEVGSAAVTAIVLFVVVVLWALAVPAVLHRRGEDTEALLGPLGLRQQAGMLVGERHGRLVSVSFDARGSRVRVKGAGEPIEVSRRGHEEDGWLRDLAAAERAADAASR